MKNKGFVKYFVYFLVSFVFVTLFSRSTSFLYVFEGFDASIFKQMGLALLRGKTLYVDYFDNKGCILYFIQALGLWLGGNFFILVLQALSLTVTLVIWDRLLTLFRDNKSKYICLGMALVLLLSFYDGGDLSEEWSLPFASYPILVYFRTLKSNKAIRPIEMALSGVCFGIIAFIRINNASVFLGFILYAMVRYLSKKDYKRVLSSLLSFAAGATIITLMVGIYFYIKAGRVGIEEMVYATFLSNFEYFEYHIKQSVLHYLAYILIIATAILLQTISTAKNKDILIPTLLSYLFFIGTSGTRCFIHYLMSLLPLFVILLATMDYTRYPKMVKVLGVVMFIPLLAYLVKPIGFLVNDCLLGKEKFKDTYSQFHQCVEGIPLAERDSIFNYNLSGIGAALLQQEGLLQCNRVIYAPLAFNLPHLKHQETTKKITEPKWILVSWDHYYEPSDARFIVDKYELSQSLKHEGFYIKRLDIGQDLTIHLYRHK